MTKVFIDGRVGTTGLRIYERLQERKDLELISLPEEERKNPEARKAALNSSDIAFLCLPDEAAKEAAGFWGGSTAIIDTSTAHRTDDAWTYGFPELKGQKDRIAKAKLIANPGCHASGFIALVAPLVQEGLISKDAALSCFSITGYSGGGKSMIADYKSEGRDSLLDTPKIYGLNQNHKHLPEMKKYCGLENSPIFSPIVSDFYSGMCVSVPLFKKNLKGSAEDIKKLYKAYYTGKLVRYEDCPEKGVFGGMLSGRDDMIVTVSGNEERILLISCFDNLGKGASGAAIQNMNILLGIDETTGIVI
ncbi:MAG: N-acetyl-gamma-glutamyl-phosphate reductase [Firmicutes bacterium]|nr:N-acetyl-gamma-glutamyl-phosphate reductase [Bacillota bacterium]